jgi:glyoxylase-like metal-dependent hydrolase (beta-lactamase superfamily II)
MPGTIIAHRDTKENFWKESAFGTKRLKDPQDYIRDIDPEGIALLTDYRVREPEITYEGRLTLFLGDVVIEAFPMPGHLSVVTTVYVPGDRVLFTADNVFHNLMAWYHESLPFEWLETLEHFKQMDVEVIVPGHGTPAGPKLLEEMRQVVEDAIGEVQKAINYGMSREEAVDRITFINRQPVPKDHQAKAPILQRLFVGRLYDQIIARNSSQSLPRKRSTK